jgi:parvulin-like peptidyl-prolyl isomerase
MPIGAFTERGNKRTRSFNKGVVSMKLSRTLLAGLLVVTAVTVVSCGKREDTVLAEFKNRSITIDEFEDAYAKVDVKFLPESSGEEGLREFLTTMLNKEIIAYKADELGYDKDQTVIQGMENFKKMGLQVAYMKFKVADKVKVTEEELREHYRNKGTSLSVKQILVDTPDEAEEVYQLLMDGADFETVCRQYSKAPDADRGGQVLTVVYGSYAQSVQRAMFALPIGGITEPVFTSYGFFIIKVLERIDAKKKEPFEEIRDQLEAEVRAESERALMNETTDKIREDAGVTWYWETLRIAFNALPQDRSMVNPPDRRDEVYPLLYFEVEDLDKPIVTYKDKMITIKDFSDYYDRSSFFRRPRREFRFSGVRNFLMEFIMAELVEDEMARSNIEEQPEVKKVIDSKREELMINRLYEDMINSQTVVTDEMIREYYDNNLDYFRIPEQRRFGVILTGDLESAQKAHAEIMSGKRFYAVAKEYSIDETTLETLAETDILVEGEQPEMDRVGFALTRVGEVSEPFETSRGWMILKLTEKAEAGSQSVIEATDAIRHALKQIENENRLTELLDKWKEELEVRINDKNFSKIQVEERSATEKPAA